MVRNRPNLSCLKTLQKYSTRGWVYRLEEGWVFSQLTPDELTEFKSYQADITIPRMRVRLPYGQVSTFYKNTRNLANWFAYCTMPQAYSLIKICQKIDEKRWDQLPPGVRRYPIGPDRYETWLWADEIKIYRELGCEITTSNGWGWHKWGVPVEWKSPAYKEHASIYALIDGLTQEVGYVGQADNPRQRYAQHMRDTSNRDRIAWIQSLQAQGRNPELIILEEKVVGTNEIYKRERYWVSYYWNQGHNLTNRAYREKKSKRKM